MAAIASKEAASQYGLKILARKIENHVENYTRFFVLERKQNKSKNTKNKSFEEKRKRKMTSVVFSLKSLSGALQKALSIFSIRDIDLLKIESRPIPGKLWQYWIYVDFCTCISEERSRKRSYPYGVALQKSDAKTQFLDWINNGKDRAKMPLNK